MLVLSLDQDVLINLPWFRLVCVQVFKIDGHGPDSAVLTALLETAQYDDAHEGPSGIGDSRHGPYPLEAITAESFQPRTAQAARAHLEPWLAKATADREPDPSDPEHRTLPLDPLIEPKLQEHVLRVLDDSVSLYELTLPKSAEGPEWRTSRADGFHEFVAIDGQRRQVTLLVCTDD